MYRSSFLRLDAATDLFQPQFKPPLCFSRFAVLSVFSAASAKKRAQDRAKGSVQMAVAN